MTARDEAIILIMRQLAIHEQINIDKIDHKRRNQLKTLASNLLATVERKIMAQSDGLQLALLRAGWLP